MLVGKATRRLRAVFPWFLAAALPLLGSSGCTASVTAAAPRVLYSEPVVYVRAAPPAIHLRPHVEYRGRPAYLVGRHWYYPADGGGVYFLEEPRELRRHREARIPLAPRYRLREAPHAPPLERRHESRRRRYN